MDIDLLSKMVKELILDHDKVSLPGLGTFVAETVPSTFSDKGYTINPPYRKLSFRPQTGDDTLLADLYSAANGVDREIASRVLNDFVSGLKSVLETRKNVVFPGLGRLRATRENNFFFIADENLEIYPEGFGLVPVSLKTHVETREEVSAAVESLADIIADTVNAAPGEPAGEDSTDVGAIGGEAVPVDEAPALSGNAVMPEEVGTQLLDTDVAGMADDSSAGESAAEDGGSAETVEAVDMDEPGISPEETMDGGAGKETEAETSTDLADAGVGGRGTWRKTLYWGLAVLLALLLLLVLYVVVSRMFPGMIDRILYDREELDILRYGGMNSWL